MSDNEKLNHLKWMMEKCEEITKQNKKLEKYINNIKKINRQ